MAVFAAGDGILRSDKRLDYDIKRAKAIAGNKLVSYLKNHPCHALLSDDVGMHLLFASHLLAKNQREAFNIILSNAPEGYAPTQFMLGYCYD